MEWDLTAASEEDLAELATWIAAYKEHRDLLHHGVAVRSDDPDPALRVHGVVAPDGAAAIFAVVQVSTGVTAPPGRVRLPGLDPERRYRVTPLAPGDVPGPRTGREVPAWWTDGVTLTGRALAVTGLQAPNQHPEHTVLLHLAAR